MKTTPSKAFGANSPTSSLAPVVIQRREPTPHDVEIEILYCGVCHSDLHMARNEWHGTIYPIVPGHEIVGKVISIGSHVTKFKIGDIAAIGCMVDSCRECCHCQEGNEQFCEEGNIGTYNDPDKFLGGQTYGGYSDRIVADEKYVLHVPAHLDLAATAPLLCAGVTTWSPLKHWGAGPGKKVGIVGIGGLGHMGIKLAKALGAYVVVFTTSDKKVNDAKRLGANEVILSSSPEQMASKKNSLDFILDCVSAEHDLNAYLNILKVDGTLALVGAPENALPIHPFSVILGRKKFAGSIIGSIAETQEMLDFCGQHNITSDIELIPIQEINTAYDRMLKGDVRYRFVIDMASLKD